MNKSIDPEGHQFFNQIATYLSLPDRQRVREAFELARREHGDERRLSGELFFTHPLTVAHYLAEYYGDAPTLIAALLHDVAEDTSVSVQEIERQFGEEVGRLVDGLTKFDRVTAKAKLGRELSPQEVKSATHFKLFEMMTGDVRIGIIKIFDRLHNLRTIQAMPPHKQQEKARETLLVYAPLANRLGMWLVKNELQELSLEVLDVFRYHIILKRIRQHEEKHQYLVENIRQQLTTLFAAQGVPVTDILFAKQDVHDIYRDWKACGGGEIPRELEAPPCIVILLENVPACYLALGHIHSLWRPVPGVFDDYIAAPRDNSYRSLHTTVTYKGDFRENSSAYFRDTDGIPIGCTFPMVAQWRTTIFDNPIAPSRSHDDRQPQRMYPRCGR